MIEQADATNLSYDNESFDAVVIANALHIMPNPEKAIKEIKRVLKKDGIIIAPTYTRETVENRFKLKLMNAVGFITFFQWNDGDYKHFIEEQQLQITYSTIIKWADFPESFVVCKKILNIGCDEVINNESSKMHIIDEQEI